MNQSVNPRASIRDVARMAGVSTSCASNVIAGRRSQDDSIGRSVMDAVSALGYRRNTIASSLRSAQSKIAGLLIPDIENPFFASLVSRLEIEAEKSGFRIVTVSSREDPTIEEREIDELVAWNAAGILLIPARHSRARAEIEKHETPFVLLDRIIDCEAADMVLVNNREASQAAMEDILSFGHNDILVLYSSDASKNMQLRMQGVGDATPEGVNVHYLKAGLSVESARQAISEYLLHNSKPTAIFSLYNPATLAAYGIALGRGWRLGEDLSLVGFDDSSWMEHAYPGVTAVSQPVDWLAQSAWRIFLERILEGRDTVKHEYVPCTYKRRGTLGAPR